MHSQARLLRVAAIAILFLPSAASAQRRMPHAGAGSFGFSGHTFDVPAGRTSYATRLDERDTLGVYLDIAVDFNTQTGLLTWTFTAIDPATNDVPILAKQ